MNTQTAKLAGVAMVFAPAIIMIMVSHALDMQGLWAYYICALGFSWAILADKID